MAKKSVFQKIEKIAPELERLYRESQVLYFRKVARLCNKFAPNSELRSARVFEKLYREKEIIGFDEVEKLEADFGNFMATVKVIDYKLAALENEYDRKNVVVTNDWEIVRMTTEQTQQDDASFEKISNQIGRAREDVMANYLKLVDLQTWAQDGYEPDWVRNSNEMHR